MKVLKYLSCVSSIRGVANNMDISKHGSIIEPIIDLAMAQATYDNVEEFIPEIRTGKVVKVYDGDTITIASRLWIDGNETSKLYKFSVRLNGIDTPELKTKNPTEKSRALLARDDLHDLIFGSIVTLSNTSYDKYGRILADVFTAYGVNVSEWMVKKGHAVTYDGGKKIRPAEWTTD